MVIENSFDIKNSIIYLYNNDLYFDFIASSHNVYFSLW